MHKSVLTIGVFSLSSLVILGVIIPFFNLNNVANADGRAPPLPEEPIIKDSNLKAEVVFEDTSPTSFAFVGPNDILVLKIKVQYREL
jgi:hypothetical protein